MQRLQDVLGTLNPEWRRDLEQFVVDEKKGARVKSCGNSFSASSLV